jgi:hypothetical protein
MGPSDRLGPVEDDVGTGAPCLVDLDHPAVHRGHGPRPDADGPAVPRAAFGTSSTMAKTLRSAKASVPMNRKLLRRPAPSKKNGSLRRPAQNRYPSAATTRISPPSGKGASAITTSPIGPVPPGRRSSRPVHGGSAPAARGRCEQDVERDVGLEVAVGVDLELVAGGRVEAGLGRGRAGVDVQDEHGPIVPRSREGVQVGDVGPRIRRVPVIRHRPPPPAYRVPPQGPWLGRPPARRWRAWACTCFLSHRGQSDNDSAGRPDSEAKPMGDSGARRRARTPRSGSVATL